MHTNTKTCRQFVRIKMLILPDNSYHQNLSACIVVNHPLKPISQWMLVLDGSTWCTIINIYIHVYCKIYTEIWNNRELHFNAV